MVTSTRKGRVFLPSETTIVRSRRPLKRSAAANAFKPIAQRLNKTWVEDVAEVTPQAVTLWCQGKRLPDTLTILNLARESDSVWRYVCEMAGRAEAIRRTDPDFHDPRFDAMQAQTDELKRRK